MSLEVLENDKFYYFVSTGNADWSVVEMLYFGIIFKKFEVTFTTFHDAGRWLPNRDLQEEQRKVSRC